ncbi:glycine-rich RNA-binding protein 4, mitochondrial [Iris pallida]|uniref:Glycine-rich RNA-binding protein 4, mitochondrial n=1 Tax=Iris pallida TaxID=29817 RepID=A0AAX6F5Y8_IRIPA|nr:glycine-rich RNA-binding protein 4, mitochondrial [Iris pallida]KAJ6811594.1 glycine-rich RNA-binding protein 4, mitochondrial [Iris pallida]
MAAAATILAIASPPSTPTKSSIPTSLSLFRNQHRELPLPSSPSTRLVLGSPRHRRSVFVACLPPPPPPRSVTPVSTKLYVSGLSFRTTEESLRNAFKSFGQLVEVNLVMDRIANRPRGFAFLRYATEEESQSAIEGMHGKFLDGRVIFVEVAKPRSELRQRSKQTPTQY